MLTEETQRCAVLYPAVAEAAHRVGARAVGLVDVGRPFGVNLQVDRVGIGYSDGSSVGDPDSPVQLTASIVGKRPIPTLAIPEVVARDEVRGDVLEGLREAFARVPADALPVVLTTWALSRLPLESRLRFLHRLDEAALRRPVAWVSVEGVGVAPAIPTFGDRHASGHSIIGVAVVEQSSLRAEAVGRCWSRGRLLAWLAGSADS